MRTGTNRIKDQIRTTLMLLLPLGVACALQAQTVTFTNTQSTVGSGLKDPAGVAVDGAGNVFIGEGLSSQIVKVPAVGGQTTLGGSFVKPIGLTTDRSGNIFVVDYYKNLLVKFSPDGSQTTVASGLANPTAVAVDAAGNLYVAEDGHSDVLKIAAGGAQTTVGTGLNRPFGVAVDGTGNVFISDTGNNRVVEVPFGGGAQTTVTDAVRDPNGLAVDGSGNLFIADSFNNRVLKVAPGGTPALVIDGLNFPESVAVDAAGDLFIADASNARVLEVQFNAVGFGGVNVCASGQSTPAPCSQTLTLNYKVSVGGTFGTPAVLTQGAPNLDFQLAGNTCTGIVADGSTCTVTVTFAPVGFGRRVGAIQLKDSTGKVLLTTALYGTGVGPIAGFNNGSVSIIASGIQYSQEFAIDSTGNLFVTQDLFFQVLKVSPNGTTTTIGSNFSVPEGIIVDGAGNVIVSNFGDNSLQRIAPDGTQTTFATNVSTLQIAQDGSGNLFVADIPTGSIIKIAPDGSQTTLATGLQYPAGVAVDALNNVYIAENYTGSLLKLKPGGSPTTLASGLTDPNSVAVDPAGNVYVSEPHANQVVKIAPDGRQTTVTADVVNPLSIAVDGAGNLIVEDDYNGRFLKLNFSQPPSLSFGNANIGTASADSPQSVTVENIGNMPLNATAPGIVIGTNFQQVAGSGTPTDCASNFSLVPGATCNLSISFIPQTAGPIQSTAVLTDNSMNGAPATQTISLTGTGNLVTSITVSAAAGQYSDKVTLSAVVGPAGATFTGSLQFQVDGANACSAAVTGSGTYTCSYTISQAAGSYSIRATLTPTSGSVQGSTGSGVLSVAKEDATIAASSNNPATVQVNTAGGTAGPITLQGTLQQAADGSLGDINKGVATVSLVPAVAGAPVISCPVTNTNGALSATCSNVPVDAYTVQWNIGGSYYQGPLANSVLAVYDPSLGFVTGSGSVKDNGVAADFAISLKYLKNGSLSGGITYVEHRATGDVTVTSTALSSMSLVGASAIIYAQATVNGVAGYTLQLTVTDNGTPGVQRDTLGLQVSGGTLAPPISFAPVAITAGNIQTH